MAKRYRTPVILSLAVLLVAVVASFAAAQIFVDPTANQQGNVTLGDLVYVAPFATLNTADGSSIVVGAESNIQDSVTLNAIDGEIALGEKVIIAHGAKVIGPARLGEEGVCPDDGLVCPSFVGFNAEVDGAVIEKDAMVLSLARVGPDIRLPSGLKVLPGKNVTTQAEAENTALGKVAAVTEADREFMKGVIEVNVSFAKNYTILAAEGSTNVFGINYDPGKTLFNPVRDLPTFNRVPTRDPNFRNRIIGDVRLQDRLNVIDMNMQSRISLRADEGEPFVIGHVNAMAAECTFHALEGTSVVVGQNSSYGFHSLVHGGPTPFQNQTIIGENFTLGAQSVFFRSRAGNNVTVGVKSLVQQSDLPNNFRVPDKTVILSNVSSPVEW